MPGTSNLSRVLSDAEGARIALIDLSGGLQREFTFRELSALVDGVARGLRARFDRTGFRVGILVENSAEFAAVYLGAMRAGGIAVPISWKLPGETLAHILADAEIDIVFSDAGRSLPPGTAEILLGGPEWSSFLDPGPFEPVSPGPDDFAQILYTSGSTGRPKGVPLTHAGQWWAVERAASFVDDPRSYRVLVAAPMFHMNALFNLKRSLRIGASTVLLPQFRAPAYVRAIELYRCDWVTCVPAMMALMAREVGEHPPPEFRLVRRIFMSSSSFSAQLLATVQRMFPNAAVLNSYGTTEAGPHVFEPHPGGLPTPPMSCGFPTSPEMVRLVDRDGTAIDGPGEGVLEMKTPAIMPGYLNLPALTRELMRDGWYHSRDLMRRDENGFFYFMGRADDMFTTGGENIYPIEVEQVLEKHPDVEQAIVVPVPDDVKQSLPVAFVVPRPGAHPTEPDLKSWFLERAPAYMHPRRISFLSELPLGPTSKIDRALLATRARDLVAERARYG